MRQPCAHLGECHYRLDSGMSDRFPECESGEHSKCDRSTSAPVSVCGCRCHSHYGAESWLIEYDERHDSYSVRLGWEDGDTITSEPLPTRLEAWHWATSATDF